MSAAIDVYSYPVSEKSAYVPLLFGGIEDRYRCVYRERGTLRDAIDRLDMGDVVIVHVHWEEFVLQECASEAQAEAAATAFLEDVAAIRARGGPLVWTIHNELPHVIPYRGPFLAMRASLAKVANVVLVHDVAAIDVLARQVELDRSKVVVLPHPSYLDRYEDEAHLLTELGAPPEPVVQAFGWIRLQKGFSEMIDMLPAEYLKSRGARIRISGGDAEAAAVIAQRPERTDVEWDVRHVPQAEVPRLLRSAACVVLPYERVLTSGVVLLAMSVGAMIVAVDIPPLRELLSHESRRFLYPREEAEAFRAIVDEIFALSPQRRRAILEANLAVSRKRHPSIIAHRLAAIYDGVLEHQGQDVHSMSSSGIDSN